MCWSLAKAWDSLIHASSAYRRRPTNTPHGTLASWPLTAQPGTHCPPCQGETQDLLQQDRLKDWIQLLANILQQEGLPKGNGIFQSGEEVPVTQLAHLQAVFPLLKAEAGRGRGRVSVVSCQLHIQLWYTVHLSLDQFSSLGQQK